MKTLIFALVLMTSFSALSADFFIKMEDIRCTISEGKVVRTQTVGTASYTEKKSVSISGLESLVLKAAEVSSQAEVNPEEDYIYKMNHDGKVYTLNLKDSKESQTLIRLTSRICR